MPSSLQTKLSILADAAKYDASCASSGAPSRSGGKKGLGSTGNVGICHSYAPDGRCISLLKILLTNFCMYDCLYCINRKSSNVRRARFTPEEVVKLTLDFYRRNYIEGLFLSSGIIQNPDYTMEQLVHVAKSLRLEHRFAGYIHLKTIPEASPELIQEAGQYADRISINIELPSQNDLNTLAPEKNISRIENAMGKIDTKIQETKEKKIGRKKPPRFSPAGQSTQLIVGATPSTDTDILAKSNSLYQDYKLRRVYYSAFSPIPDASSKLPLIQPPLIREHRLYQADWLLRFYGFKAKELTSSQHPNLDLDVNPKLSWALRHRHYFPININLATKEELLRIPGIGVRNVQRILTMRKWKPIRFSDLIRMRARIQEARPFIITSDYQPGSLLERQDLKQFLVPKPQQLSLGL